MDRYPWQMFFLLLVFSIMSIAGAILAYINILKDSKTIGVIGLLLAGFLTRSLMDRLLLLYKELKIGGVKNNGRV